jgi:cytochrome c553
MRARFRCIRSAFVAILAIALLSAAGAAIGAEQVEPDFETQLARVDEAIRTNPGRVSGQAIDSCLKRRHHAVRLMQQNEPARARRSLDYCFQVLHVSKTIPRRETKQASLEEIQARAAREMEEALTLTPDLEHGLEIYRTCAECHQPEGWGMAIGSVPQIAGQHRSVVIKQLADIRAGNRVAVLMAPYATVQAIGGVQSVADVAGYIDTLEISTSGGKGTGENLALGETLYRDNCARCHGPSGEGNAEAFVPRIQAQHFNYMLRQFEDIQDGRRRNANPEMRAQVAGFDEEQTRAVLDYVSRLEPPEELQAPPGWQNPDFAQ